MRPSFHKRRPIKFEIVAYTLAPFVINNLIYNAQQLFSIPIFAILLIQE